MPPSDPVSLLSYYKRKPYRIVNRTVKNKPVNNSVNNSANKSENKPINKKNRHITFKNTRNERNYRMAETGSFNKNNLELAMNAMNYRTFAGPNRKTPRKTPGRLSPILAQWLSYFEASFDDPVTMIATISSTPQLNSGSKIRLMQHVIYRYPPENYGYTLPENMNRNTRRIR